MALSLRQLTYFLALAEEGHFGRAAARVHISQPALSMQIRDMEADLGVALVERRSRDIRLSRAGRAVMERARHIVGAMGELEAAARREARSGRLNLGLIPTVAPYLLPLVLTRLRAADLGRDIRVREAQTDILLRDLDDGRLDAIVIATPPPGRGIAAQPLFADRFLLAASAQKLDAVARDSEALRPRALDPAQLLLLDEGHCLADQALHVCGLDRRSARLDLGASSLSTLCGLVAQGFGLTFLPEIAVRSELAAAGDMRLARFSSPEPERQVLLVRRSASGDDRWFDDLAAVLVGAGTELVAHARRVVA